MRWRGRRESGNVTDLRGRGGGFGLPGGGGLGLPGGGMRLPIPMGGSRGGGFGCGTLVIIGVVLWFLGINPLSILTGGGLGNIVPSGPAPEQFNPTRQTQTGQGQTRQAPSDDEAKQFVSTILGSTEEIWGQLFTSYGRDYPEPQLVLFRGGVNSACGMASSASGPFYCPSDQKVYIDLSFYDQLARQFGAPGDFAQAYVLAHEVGHHVQNIIGVLPEFNRMRQGMGKLEVNQMSVQVELQADCLAGVWGFYVRQQGWLEGGDIEEAINAATQIGDDMIQKRTQGYVVPDAFNHGSSEQRAAWFTRGFESGRIESCNTFDGRR